ncbi:MAG: glutamate--tRNA ligase [Piscirickettsiaceae bacterium]|nr:glutamate--tRNA ligase [Piscirickettsiaceae bacterium]
MNTKTRFAPSPTGLIHLGNARTALFNALLAIRDHGEFVLRIEDTDRKRSKNKFLYNIITDLRWLGINWHEGPEVGGKHAPYIQSKRKRIYQSYYHELEKQGKIYPCFCSEKSLRLVRKGQVLSGQPPRYTGTCTNLTEKQVKAKIDKENKYALRFRVPKTQIIRFNDLIRREQKFASRDIGDFIISRRDGSPAFLFSNAVDDALMGITYVLRGDDHLSNTPRQIMIMEALHLPCPIYGHISMVVDGINNSPLSKRYGSNSVNKMRELGYLAGAVTNYLARLGHHFDNNRYQSVEELATAFDIDRLGHSPTSFDIDQLDFWQKKALSTLSDNKLWQWMGEQVHQLVPPHKQQLFVKTIRPNILFPNEALVWAKILFAVHLNLNDNAKATARCAGARFYQHTLTALDNHNDDYQALIAELRQLSGAKGKSMFIPLRVALTGQYSGPELDKILILLGQNCARSRFKSCLQAD